MSRRKSRPRIPSRLVARIRDEARNRCGFCLCSETLVGMRMELEHLVPLSAGGLSVEGNLWLSCRRCNEFKASLTHAADPETGLLVEIFDPRRQRWDEHFCWNDDGTGMVGISSVGRATVVALKLNHKVIVVARKLWVSAGWWPPED